MAQRCRKGLREEGSCAVCLDFFADPVTLDCGHNFCRACIARCWQTTVSVSCPLCRERIWTKKLRSNLQLGNLTAAAKELTHFMKRQGEAREQQALLNARFCQDQEAAARPQERGEHRVEVPVEGAAPVVKIFLSFSSSTFQLQMEMEAEKEKTAAAFRQQRQFLEEQEKLLLAQMKEVEQEIARRRNEQRVTLSAELCSLDSLLLELEEKRQSANEPLENPGDILERCKKSFESHAAFPVALKWRIHELCDTSPFLEGLKKQFRECLIPGLQIQHAKLSLDPATAHPKLILSEDGKSVRHGEEYQDVPYNLKRFNVYPFVLDHGGFATGRHFWDVTLGSEEDWCVGVAGMSVRRKGDFDLGTKSRIWALGKWGGQCRLLEPSLDPPPPTLGQDLKRIRVSLNCAGEQVAFFDADTGEILYVYSGASFSGEILLPFFSVLQGGHLTLSS